MQRRQGCAGFKLVMLGVTAASAVVLYAGALALAATVATGTTYSFDLATANTAVSPNGGMMASRGD